MAKKLPKGPYVVVNEGRRWFVRGPGDIDEEVGKDDSEEAEYLQTLLNIAATEGAQYGVQCSICKHSTAHHSVDGGCQDEFCRCGEKGTWGDEEDEDLAICECGCSEDEHEGGVGSCQNCTDEEDGVCEAFENEEE